MTRSTRANKVIYQTAKTQSNCEGMGTTVVAGLLFDDKLTIAHVGDSRLYRCRDGKLEQVTQDHSLLQELVSRGFYTPEEAQRAAAKNYVTRALGVEPTVDVEITEVPALKDDVYLLCSDGLSDMVEDDDIQLTINTFGANLETVAKQLVLLGQRQRGPGQHLGGARSGARRIPGAARGHRPDTQDVRLRERRFTHGQAGIASRRASARRVQHEQGALHGRAPS